LQDIGPTASRADRIHELKPHVTLPEAEAAVREADAFLAEAQDTFHWISHSDSQWQKSVAG